MKLDSLAARLEHLDRTVLQNPYIPIRPSPKQATFCCLDDYQDVLFGGAAGGGKSAGLLMAAVQYVPYGEYRAIIVRRETTMLTKGEGIYSLSHEWFGAKGVDWNEQKKVWRFPSGATIEFAHMQHEQDRRNFLGSAWHFIGFDELTQFSETQARFVMGRRRRRAGSPIPIRMRATSNPGDVGHKWVKEMFVPHEYLSAPASDRAGRIWHKGGRVFVPSMLDDNPGLDCAEYDKTLRESLTGHEYQQMRYGDWSDWSGGIFVAGNFRQYSRAGAGSTAHYDFDGRILEHTCMSPTWFTVDPAGSDSDNRQAKQTNTNSYSVIQHWGITSDRKRIVLLDQWRKQADPLELHRQIVEWNKEKRPDFVGIEDSPVGKPSIYHAKSAGVNIRPLKHMGQDKLARAHSYRIRVEQGDVWIPKHARWATDFLAEHAQWQGGKTEVTDQIDAAAYAIRIADEYLRTAHGKLSGIVVGKTPTERLQSPPPSRAIERR